MSPVQSARWKSSAPVCDGRNDGTNMTLRSKRQSPRLRPLQTPRDYPPDRWSPGFPGLLAASNSTLKNNQTSAPLRRRQTTRHSSCPRTGAAAFVPRSDSCLRERQRLTLVFALQSRAPERRLSPPTCWLPAQTKGRSEEHTSELQSR